MASHFGTMMSWKILSLRFLQPCVDRQYHKIMRCFKSSRLAACAACWRTNTVPQISRVGKYEHLNSYLLQKRTFGIGVRLNVKLFRDRENEYAHAILERSPQYQKTLANFNIEEKAIDEEEFNDIINKDWSSQSAENVAKAFRKISLYAPQNSYHITDDIFGNLCDSIKQKCKEMTDSDLLSILASLSKWPETESIDSKNFTIWGAVDKECKERIKDWDRNQLLYVADHWYRLNLGKVSSFMMPCSRKVGRRPANLTPPQLVQIMFYINVHRKHHSAVTMFEVEYSLDKCIHELSIDEVAVLSMGFFKSQTRIHGQNLISKIIDKLVENVNTVEDVSLTAILKILKYCAAPDLAEKMYYLLSQLQPQIPRLSLMSCMHVALCATNIQVFHEGAVRDVCQRFSTVISSARAKELERLAFILAHYNYDPKTEPCIYKSITQELENPERVAEFMLYPKCKPRCLSFLSLREIYPLEHIAKSLEKDFLDETYGKNRHNCDREILLLDVGVDVECPQYQGPRLDLKDRTNVAIRFFRHVPDENKEKMSPANKLFVQILQTCKKLLGGPEYVCPIYVLPQSNQADIVVCLNATGQPLEIPASFRELGLGAIKRPEPSAEGVVWCCLVVAPPTMYIRLLGQPLGPTVCRLRQTKALGYRAALVPYFDWYPLSAMERETYIHNLLTSLVTQAE